ncbi:MAG: ABC transporter permease [Clostridiales bacterium]
MIRYLTKRIILSIVTLLVLITATFLLMQLLPGDPFTGEKVIKPEILENMKEKYGLDKPLYIQYFNYLKNLLHGDLGDSLNFKNRSVNAIISESFKYSFELGLRALIFGIIGGLIIGIIASINRGKFLDSISIFIAVIGVSVPSFIIGAIIQYFLGYMFSAYLKEALGLTYNFFPITGWESFWHKLLPPFALGMSALASISRLMRSSMLEVLGLDYIKTAKAKGLTSKKVIFKHTIRNAIIPVITYLGPLTAMLLTGTFVIEQIFDIPGLGKHFVDSVRTNDYTLLSGLTIFYGAFLISAIVIVDILYGIIDPRIRLDGKKG